MSERPSLTERSSSSDDDESSLNFSVEFSTSIARTHGNNNPTANESRVILQNALSAAPAAAATATATSPFYLGNSIILEPPSFLIRNNSENRSSRPFDADNHELLPVPSSAFHPVKEVNDSELSHPRWGIPEPVLSRYARLGLTQMYQWQVEALSVPGVHTGTRNLVYSAPTSAGKTLVADIALIRRLFPKNQTSLQSLSRVSKICYNSDKSTLETKMDEDDDDDDETEVGEDDLVEVRAVFVLPFVAAAMEKMRGLRSVLGVGTRVVGFYGSAAPSLTGTPWTVAVCTIEKANQLVNMMIEAKRTRELVSLSVDEAHVLRDSKRGGILELLVTKVKHMFSRAQIVCLSATMPNLGDIARWLHAEIYATDFRSVPLLEYVKVSNIIYNLNHDIADRDANALGEPRDLGPPSPDDPSYIVPLCWEVASQGRSVLVFCATRRAAEQCAAHLARFMRKIPPTANSKKGYKTDNNIDARSAMLTALSRAGSEGSLDPILEKSVPKGIAFHHAGLTTHEREIIETGFRQGVILVLTATGTLGLGVNLPARRVIFRSPYVGTSFMDPATYQQMKGRAGRRGLDTRGESIVMCEPNEVHRVREMVTAPGVPVTSTLLREPLSFVRAVLESVTLGIASSFNELQGLFCKTLVAVELTKDRFVDLNTTAREALLYLYNANLIECHQPEQTQPVKLDMATCLELIRAHDDFNIKATRLGEAIAFSGMCPSQGIEFYKEMVLAQQHFVLADELHVVYHATPVYLLLSVDWSCFSRAFAALNSAQCTVAEAIGVSRDFVDNCAAFGAPSDPGNSETKVPLSNGVLLMPAPPKELALVRKYRRFFAAMVLNDLIHEVSVDTVSRKYGLNKGNIQALQQSSAAFSGMASAFCDRLGWRSMGVLVSQLRERMDHGIEPDLVALMAIPNMRADRARMLLKAGFRSPADLACANISVVTMALIRGSPFSGREATPRTSEYHVRTAQRTASKVIKAATLLLEEEAQGIQHTLSRRYHQRRVKKIIYRTKSKHR